MSQTTKPRHKWGELEKLDYTEQQKCINCGVYRFKQLGAWGYTNTKHTKKINYPKIIKNEGCKKNKIKLK